MRQAICRLPPGSGSMSELVGLRHRMRRVAARRVRDAQDAEKQVLVVPHEGAVVAEPGWDQFSPLRPFPDEVGAWWWDGDKERRRIAQWGLAAFNLTSGRLWPPGEGSHATSLLRTKRVPARANTSP